MYDAVRIIFYWKVIPFGQCMFGQNMGTREHFPVKGLSESKDDTALYGGICMACKNVRPHKATWKHRSIKVDEKSTHLIQLTSAFSVLHYPGQLK